jgi:hypothetical protein
MISFFIIWDIKSKENSAITSNKVFSNQFNMPCVHDQFWQCVKKGLLSWGIQRFGIKFVSSVYIVHFHFPIIFQELYIHPSKKVYSILSSITFTTLYQALITYCKDHYSSLLTKLFAFLYLGLCNCIHMPKWLHYRSHTATEFCMEVLMIVELWIDQTTQVSPAPQINL